MNEQAVPYMLMDKNRAIALLKRFETAKTKRNPFVSIWQEVANYILPYRGGFYDVTNSGSISAFDRSVEIYDDTATNALIKAAAAFYSYTANPATQWFNFSLVSSSASNKSDPRYSIASLMADSAVKTFLEDSAATTVGFINGNSQAGMHALAQEVLAFSASALYTIEDPSDAMINIQPISVKDLYVLNNASGGIQEVYRTIPLTNEQIVQEFGETGYIPKEITDAVASDPLKERVLIHVVMPRANRDTQALDALNMPFASLWIDYQSKVILQESGYEEMPYSIARINVPAGAIFGFSPAMNVRHTVKSLNKLVKQKLSAGDLALMPSMNVPLDTYVNPLSLKPAAQNYHEADAQNRAEPMHTIGNFQINTETIKDARDQVRQGMLIDLIEQTDKDNTYQAMQEQLLQLKLMSPWQGGIEKDCLKPLVIRVYNILDRRGGILPEMPELLKEALATGKVKLKIVYDSPLAKAQQHFKLSAVERTAAFAMPLAQFGSMKIINIEETMRIYSELIGSPSAMLYSKNQLAQINKEEADAIRAQQEQQNSMLQSQQIKEGAGAVRDMATAQATAANGQQQPGSGGQIPPELQGTPGLPA